MQLGDNLKHLPFVVVDAMWSFQEANLVEFHSAISHSDQGAIEILWMSEGSIPGQPDLARRMRPPFPRPVSPKEAEAVSQLWPVWWPCHCWDWWTAATLGWHWHFPGEKICCFVEKEGRAHFESFPCPLPPMRGGFGKRRCRRWDDGHIKIRVDSKGHNRHTVLLGLLNIGHLKCWTWVFPGL